MVFGLLQQYIVADVGLDFKYFGQGLLYSWVKMDEIGLSDDLVYIDEIGEYEYICVEEEMVWLEDFVCVLYIGFINLIEWYFFL